MKNWVIGILRKVNSHVERMEGALIGWSFIILVVSVVSMSMSFPKGFRSGVQSKYNAMLASNQDLSRQLKKLKKEINFQNEVYSIMFKDIERGVFLNCVEK